jgi:ribose 5-phosphate isomerase RpiB
MIKAFFTTKFEGGRHEKRIGKLRNVWSKRWWSI